MDISNEDGAFTAIVSNDASPISRNRPLVIKIDQTMVRNLLADRALRSDEIWWNWQPPCRERFTARDQQVMVIGVGVPVKQHVELDRFGRRGGFCR